jgi:hypothetical protein
MRASALLCLGVLLAGCHWLLPFPPGQGSPDQRAVPELRSPEAGRSEAGSLDGPTRDGARSDAARRDGARDAARDRPHDHPHDRSPDSSPDQLATSPCATGMSALQLVGWSNMVACSPSVGVPVDQCNAHTRCNEGHGWHLCTATEYKNHGGKTASLVPSPAWIGGCSMRGPSSMAPVADGPCATCDGTTTPPAVPANIPCGGGGATYVQWNALGVAAGATCYSVSGANVDEAYWQGMSTAYPLNAAMCCSQ